ncbi:SAM dependent carboxyl methyltransferase [Trema orientale]|uniref:SAM dependent carboxyl methyltransferase n=1 Tax=Trema orientale TaxID=63057 RepID=A0A2P5E9U8_TREOI|nr:SAM dependent carboxyl methyltransferase [Trema orientale]
MAETDHGVAYPVPKINGGSDRYSYSKNSNFQRKGIDCAKELINKAIAEKLDVNIFASSKTFRLADLGCAAGPNTFFAVQNIIDALELKCQGQGESCQVPEFQVFFNDLASNDFNELFQSLPPERRYFAAGVPGLFHGRIFPSDSIHFVHSSYAVQVLSRVPEEVLDKESPAWNRGRINYSDSPDEVVKCFEAQYAKDMESFLKARAKEIVLGGLMAFVVPGRPNRTPHSETFVNRTTTLMGSCLLDMANKGKVSHEKLDSFNMPTYFASPEELEEFVKRNGCFSVEIMEIQEQERPEPKVLSSTIRGGIGGMIKEYFGLEEDISDEIFDLFLKKLEEHSTFIFESGNAINLFVLLKRVV